MDSQPAVPLALAIAGSDSGGGAGIQADLKTFHQWGVYGTSVVTAVTAQNTLGVQAVHALPPAMVAAQIASVAADLPPGGVKVGMLANAAIARAVAEAAERWGLGGFVLDPVMVATSGDVLLSADAVAWIRGELVPMAGVVTPNWPEAAMLTGVADESVEGMEEAARALVEGGAGAALVKGGHLGGDEVVDLFWDGRVRRVFRGPRIDTPHTHGTGCTLSAALAAGLARGAPLADAAAGAVAWVRRAIASAPGLGAGNGPVDHFAEVASAGSRASSSVPSVRPADDA